ncbi:MAG: zinc ABC transporter substrate-binding protein [Fidelibacterota bacterium]|nr:MAG: zinc ABC transporter substrate-binding protein [Candidatus Neomarinimicrobiota bacterium]
MQRICIGLILFLTIASGRVRVVTATTDLKDITEAIGGDRVTVTSIARGNQDPHYVEVLPSYMLKVKKADLYLMVGMELDLWSDRIIDGSRNRKLRIVDCSKDIERLEVPTRKVDASLGDIHRFGNPHYWLDPVNGKVLARTITEALVEADPEGRAVFEANLAEFERQVDERLAHWLEEYASLKDRKIMFYHNSWPYFTRRFGLETVQFLEPKPGVPPSPAHLNRLLDIVQKDTILVVGMESYFSDQTPRFLADRTGAKVIKLAQSVEALPGVDSYLDVFDYNLHALAEALGD